jgi:short-subunit dehydrogenase
MRNRRMDLRGKRIVLTGASSGIGRALAVALAEKDAVLLLAARRRELLDEVAAEIEGAGHRRPVVVDTDLSTAGAAESLGRYALNALDGTVDVVINNAGANVTGPQTLIGDSAPARTMFEVNVWSPLALTAALLPSMMAAGWGVIVNVTSTVQAVPLPLVGY